MIIFGIVASFAALGAICWILFNLAVFALPFFAGVTAGTAAYHSGAGPLGAIMVGIGAGVATLLVGQLALTFAFGARSHRDRAAVRGASGGRRI